MGLTRVTTAAALPLFKSEKDSRRLTVTAALTYPGFDRAGDRLNPAGGRYELHKANPWVGYEHLRWNTTGTDWVHADARNASDRPVVIGKATGPNGNYAVEHRAVTINSKAVALPFGTTYFDGRDRLQSQMFGLIEDDTLPAVSLELTLVPGMYKSLAASPLEPHRPAYDMTAWSCLGWVHCAEPVNPGALTLRKALTPATERAIRVAELGKVRGEAAHPLILKAFRDRYAPALGKSSTVSGLWVNPPTVRKAMDETAALDPAYTPDEPDGDEAAPAAGGSTPTVQALYQLAQSLADMKSQVEEMLAGSEHVKGKKFATKLLADLDDTAADATEMAAKIEAELGAKGDAAEDAPEPEPDVQDGDNEPDEDGVLKAIKRRPAVFKAIKRFTIAEYHKAAPVEPTPVPDDQDTPEARAEYDREMRAYRRAQRKYGAN